MISRSSRWMLAAALIATVAVAANMGCKSHSNPFPDSGSVAGWEKTSDTRVFAARDLWQYIDGDAEQYLSAGVVSTSTSDYKYHGQLEAVVDVYSMSAPEGARKILETGLTKDVKTIQLGDEGVQYTQSVTFRKGSNLVRIVAYESTPDTPQALLALAHGVEARL